MYAAFSSVSCRALQRGIVLLRPLITLGSGNRVSLGKGTVVQCAPVASLPQVCFPIHWLPVDCPRARLKSLIICSHLVGSFCVFSCLQMVGCCVDMQAAIIDRKINTLAMNLFSLD